MGTATPLLSRTQLSHMVVVILSQIFHGPSSNHEVMCHKDIFYCDGISKCLNHYQTQIHPRCHFHDHLWSLHFLHFLHFPEQKSYVQPGKEGEASTLNNAPCQQKEAPIWKESCHFSISNISLSLLMEVEGSIQFPGLQGARLYKRIYYPSSLRNSCLFWRAGEYMMESPIM